MADPVSDATARNQAINALLDPMTEIWSSIVRCLACRIVGPA